MLCVVIVLLVWRRECLLESMTDAVYPLRYPDAPLVMRHGEVDACTFHSEGIGEEGLLVNKITMSVILNEPRC